MITEISYDKDLLGKEVRGTNTSYWGISALQAGHDDIRQDIYLETVWQIVDIKG